MSVDRRRRQVGRVVEDLTPATTRRYSRTAMADEESVRIEAMVRGTRGGSRTAGAGAWAEEAPAAEKRKTTRAWQGWAGVKREWSCASGARRSRREPARTCGLRGWSVPLISMLPMAATDRAAPGGKPC